MEVGHVIHTFLFCAISQHVRVASADTHEEFRAFSVSTEFVSAVFFFLSHIPPRRTELAFFSFCNAKVCWSERRRCYWVLYLFLGWKLQIFEPEQKNVLITQVFWSFRTHTRETHNEERNALFAHLHATGHDLRIIYAVCVCRCTLDFDIGRSEKKNHRPECAWNAETCTAEHTHARTPSPTN